MLFNLIHGCLAQNRWLVLQEFYVSYIVLASNSGSMSTPSRKSVRLGGIEGSVESTPVVALSSLIKKSRTQSTGRPAKKKPPAAGMDTVLEEKEEGSEADNNVTVFNGNLTLGPGQLSAAKRKQAEAEFEKELENRCDEIAAKISEDCMREIQTLKANHAKEIADLNKQLATVGVKRSRTSVDKWSYQSVCKYLIYQKLKNLNDGHSTQATNREIQFNVSKEELAVCLHCLDDFVDPEECIFKKGRTGSYRHRKPKSDSALYDKCVKAGIVDVDNENHYVCRHIHGKDYMLFR